MEHGSWVEYHPLSTMISLNGTLITSSTKKYPYRDAGDYAELRTRRQDVSAYVGPVLQRHGRCHTGRMDSLTFTGLGKEAQFGKRKSRGRHDGTSTRRHILSGEIYAERGQREDKAHSQQRRICLMGNAHFKVRIMHASLFVRKVKLMPSIFLAHAKALERGTAKYPLRRVVCKSFTIPHDYRDVNYEKLSCFPVSCRRAS